MSRTTNYSNAFIEVAPDSMAEGVIPGLHNGKRTVALEQFEMLINDPYRYSSDDVLFEVHCIRKEINHKERELAREEYFSKGQACFRAQALTKTHGWGVHFNADAKMAIYPKGSDEYQKFATDPQLEHYKAMRSSRKKS